MNETIETISCAGGHMLETSYDEGMESPRTWYHHGTIYSNHRDYNPDGHSIEEVVDDEGELTIADTHYMLPIYAYIHSGISLSTSRGKYPFNDRWDSGLFGIIAVEKSEAAKAFPEDTEARAMKALEGEVKLLNAWYNGHCYGYVLYDRYGDVADSCSGYLGDDAYDDMVEEAKAVAEAEARREAETEYVTGKSVVSVEVSWRVPKDKAEEIGEAGITAALESLVLAPDPTAWRSNGVAVTEAAAV